MAASDVKRLIDDHALGDVEERSAAPARGLKGGELVVADGDDRPLEDRPQQLAVFDGHLLQAAEEDAAGVPKPARGCSAGRRLSTETALPARSTPSLNSDGGGEIASLRAAGRPNCSRRKPRMSVRIHSSCRRSGKGSSQNVSHASRRRSASQAGSPRD